MLACALQILFPKLEILLSCWQLAFAKHHPAHFLFHRIPKQKQQLFPRTRNKRGMASNNLGRINKTVTQNYFRTNAENMESIESIFTRFMCRSSLLVFIIGEPVVDCVDLKIVNLKIDAGAKIERCV